LYAKKEGLESERLSSRSTVEMSQTLEQIIRINDATEQSAAFAAILDPNIVKANGNPSLLIQLFQKLLSDEVPVQVTLS
jgi:hypothetical protein